MTHAKEELLSAAGLSVEFKRAEGDHLFMADEQGKEVPVLDLVGGFGACMLGHHHPEVHRAMQDALEQRRPLQAQGSHRAQAGLLKQELADYLRRHTGVDHCVNLLNTGTEAVEAALKHALYAHRLRMDALGTQTTANLQAFRQHLHWCGLDGGDAFLREAERLLGVAPLDSAEALATAVSAVNMAAFMRPARTAAFPRAFHGKTLGSLAHTWNRDARLPFIGMGSNADFIHDPGAFLAALDGGELAYYEIAFEPLRLVRRQRHRLAAVIYEPLRGEGGVLPLGDEEKQLLCALRARHPEVALIADEIQCGLGRTGRPVESHAEGLPADYFTFAKSLGGGLVKVAALAVRKDLYLPGFSMLHTSTFAEDDLSSIVGRRTLQVIEQDGLAQRSAEVGNALLEALRILQSNWPGVVREVRGRGCMLGLELQDLSNHESIVLAGLARGDLLGMVCAAYLLHHHRVRVLPSLGQRRVLRLQPSAYLSRGGIEQAVQALRALFELLAAGDTCQLLRHLAGDAPAGAGAKSESAAQAPPGMPVTAAPARLQAAPAGGCERVGFIAHLIDPDSMREMDPRLAAWSDPQMRGFVERIRPTVEPGVMISRQRMRSAIGREVEMVVYGVMMDSQAIEADMRDNRSRVFRRLVHATYLKAAQDGCSVVGFGGYSSIVTGSCASVRDGPAAVTSGNSLTVATSLASMRRAASAHGILLAGARVAVVGAAGNIGRVQAALLARCCGGLVLVGRPGSLTRLRGVAAEIAERARPALHPDSNLGGLAQQVQRRFGGAAGSMDAATIARFLEQEGLVQLAEDARACREADIVVCASNSATPLVSAEHLARHKPVLVCDVAVPGDADVVGLAACPGVRLIHGGVVRLPTAPDFVLTGMLLGPGRVYACAAETLLLGLSGIRRDFSKGSITPGQVQEIDALARLHGFEIDDAKQGSAF